MHSKSEIGGTASLNLPRNDNADVFTKGACTQIATSFTSFNPRNDNSKRLELEKGFILISQIENEIEIETKY